MKKAEPIARGTHERLIDDQEIKGSSDRGFGIVFAVVFSVIGLWPLLSGEMVRWWALAIALIFVVVALVRPVLLAPLNRLWMKFGLLLHKVVNPVVMAVIFFGAITPFALVMRVLGKDHLHLRFDPAAKSYWIERVPPGPAPETMKNQF